MNLHGLIPSTASVEERTLFEALISKINANGTVTQEEVRRQYANALVGFSSLQMPTTNDLANAETPHKPINFQAVGAFTTVTMDWQAPIYKGHAFTEVYKTKGTLVQEAIAEGLLAYVRTNTWSDAVSTDTQWTYYTRHVNLRGEVGPWSDPVTITTGVPADEVIAILEGQIAETELTTALRTRIDLVDADAATPGSVNARVLAEAEARGAAILAEAEARGTALLAESTARASADTALAQQITTLSASVDTDIGTLTSALQTESTTRASADTALAQQITTLSASVDTDIGTLTSALQTESTTRAEQTGELYAQYTVKIDQNNHVSGFGLASETVDGQTVSSFNIAADRFAIMDPTVYDPLTNTPSAINIPFIVVNGQVYIKSATIQDAAITNAKIADLAVDSAKIADAAITTAKIADLAVDTAKIADAAITNAKIESLDAAKVTTGTLDADRVAAGAITADKLAANSITTDKIAAGAVDSISIASTLQSDNYVAGTSGWRLSKVAAVLSEFNSNVAFRGSVDVNNLTGAVLKPHIVGEQIISTYGEPSYVYNFNHPTEGIAGRSMVVIVIATATSEWYSYDGVYNQGVRINLYVNDTYAGTGVDMGAYNTTANAIGVSVPLPVGSFSVRISLLNVGHNSLKRNFNLVALSYLV